MLQELRHGGVDVERLADHRDERRPARPPRAGSKGTCEAPGGTGARVWAGGGRATMRARDSDGLSTVRGAPAADTGRQSQPHRDRLERRRERSDRGEPVGNERAQNPPGGSRSGIDQSQPDREQRWKNLGDRVRARVSLPRHLVDHDHRPRQQLGRDRQRRRKRPPPTRAGRAEIGAGSEGDPPEPIQPRPEGAQLEADTAVRVEVRGQLALAALREAREVRPVLRRSGRNGV